MPKDVLRGIAADPARFIRAAAATPVKISPETLVLQSTLRLGDQSLAVVVKQYWPQTIWKALAAWFRPSKAARNWAKAEFLLAHGIDTPCPLLACRLRWLASGGSFLVSQWIAGGENLHRFGWRIGRLPPGDRLRIAAACADRLGRLIGRMHLAGAAHRDLKAANLLVAEGNSGLQTWLIDLDGLKIGRSVSFARQARDLARLAAGLTAHPWVTRSVCRRFLRAYAQEFPQAAVAWKPLWRAIAAGAARIVARKQRRGEEVL